MRFGIAVVAFACIALAVLGGTAGADPNTDRTLTYHFYDCGSVPDFDAVKQPGQAAALHLRDGSGTFVAVKSVVLGDQTVDGTFYADGTVLFATPGFEAKNDRATITCTNRSETSHILTRVTGFIAPAN